MHTNREILGEQLGTCEEKLKGLTSYVKELKTMTAKHNTPKEQYDADLNRATNDIEFYEGEIARIKQETGTVAKEATMADSLLPKTRNQGIGAAILSSISFLAGAILGSQLKSGKSSKVRQSGN